MEKTFIANPIPFYKRFLHQFFNYIGWSVAPTLIIIVSKIIIIYKITSIVFIIVIIANIAYRAACYHFNKITVTNEFINFHGYNVNKAVHLAENITKVKVYPKDRCSRSGHIGYYLLFKKGSRKYYINDYMNWPDNDVIDLFHAFKEAKNEKVVLDEKIILNLTKY